MLNQFGESQNNVRPADIGLQSILPGCYAGGLTFAIENITV